MTDISQISEPAVASESVLGADRLKHLEFIQAIVARLGNSSFLMRGWTLTIVSALLALLTTRFHPWLAAAGLVPLTAFWFLDGYFLWQERLFRALYDDVRTASSSVPLMSMDVRPYTRGMFSNTRVGVCIWLLRRPTGQPAAVRFVDARHRGRSTGPHVEFDTTDVAGIAAAVTAEGSVECSVLATCEDIQARRYSLHPPEYLDRMFTRSPTEVACAELQALAANVDLPSYTTGGGWPGRPLNELCDVRNGVPHRSLTDAVARVGTSGSDRAGRTSPASAQWGHRSRRCPHGRRRSAGEVPAARQRRALGAHRRHGPSRAGQRRRGRLAAAHQPPPTVRHRPGRAGSRLPAGVPVAARRPLFRKPRVAASSPSSRVRRTPT